MTRTETRVVFMGTPDFSVPTLNALLKAGYNVVGVVTQPDRPRGRGHRITPSPVKNAAEANGIPVIQMQKISTPEGIAALEELQPDFLVTAAFGQILSDELLRVPKQGCINVHASLLPEYRGSSPVAHAIMQGEAQTGITTMYTVREVDAGPILLQDTIDIGSDETCGALTERLADLGGETLVRTLDGLINGTLKPTEQDASRATYYPRFSKGYGEIDWERPAQKIADFVRALNPAPGAYFMLGDEKVGVLRASSEQDRTDQTPGTILAADPRAGLTIAAGDGTVLSLDVIRRQGARAMPAAESLRGRKIAVGGQLHRRASA